jgi:hypothetical protein
MLSLLTFDFQLLTSLRAFAPLHLREPPRRRIALNRFTSLCLCVLVPLCYAFLLPLPLCLPLFSSLSLCVFASLRPCVESFRFSHFQRQRPVFPPCQCRKWQAAVRSPVPAVFCQCSASLACSRRRKFAMQRQPPVFPPFTTAANWQNFACFAICASAAEDEGKVGGGRPLPPSPPYIK